MRVARQVSLACGDVAFAMIKANLSCLLELDFVPIPELLGRIREYQEIMKKYGQASNLEVMAPSLFILLSCSGERNGGFTVIQDAAAKTGPFKEVAKSESLVGQWCHYSRMLVAFLFDRIDEASHHVQFCSDLVKFPTGSGDTAMACFIDALVTLQKCRRQR